MSPCSPRLSRSSATFSRQGFYPLAPQKAASMTSNAESNIPLTPIGTKVPLTGSRKPGEDTINDSALPDSFENEKTGWSGRRHTRRSHARPLRVNTDGKGVQINSLGRLYKKVVEFSVVTWYLVYVLPIALFIALPITIYAIFKPNAQLVNTGIRVCIFWTWIEVVWLSIWISKLVSQAIPHIFVTLCGVISAGTRKYAAILHAVEIQLSLVGWTLSCLVSFTALTSPDLNYQGIQRRWVSIVYNFLVAAYIASILFLAEKMLVQLISINYHRRSFDNRIKENKSCVRLLSLLYDASRKLFPTNCKEFAEEDHIINASIIDRLNLTKDNHSRSATSSRFVGEIGKIGDKFTNVFGNIASEITGKQVFNQNSPQSIVTEALEKTRSTEALAKRLWMSFVPEDQDALHLEDLKEVLGSASYDKAEECFAILDSDENGDITLKEMITKIVELGKDRKTIAASMRDVGQAISVLDQVLTTILLVIIIFIFRRLLPFRVNPQKLII